MKRDRKNLLYVSHPSGGLQENTLDIEKCIRALYKKHIIHNKFCLVSPVHCYGFMYNDNPELEYDYRGLSYCTDLLMHCDSMIVIGDWENSTGCKEEIRLCNLYGIPYVKVKTSDELIEKLNNNDIDDILELLKQ
jgi:hypothetical protein